MKWHAQLSSTISFNLCIVKKMIWRNKSLTYVQTYAHKHTTDTHREKHVIQRYYFIILHSFEIHLKRISVAAFKEFLCGRAILNELGKKCESRKKKLNNKLTAQMILLNHSSEVWNIILGTHKLSVLCCAVNCLYSLCRLSIVYLYIKDGLTRE